jgi:3-phosphoshikimate 1-carboxyvinyltransferase
VQKKIIIQPSQLSGRLVVPPSKSQCLRAILFAGMAGGQSEIRNVLESPDVEAMLTAITALGANYQRAGNVIKIHGVAGQLKFPQIPVDAGNSGIVLRFIAALVANLSHPVVITGDTSICHQRPIYPYIEGFSAWGVSCESVHATGYAPIKVCGPIARDVTMCVEGADSQIVSGLLIAASQAAGRQVIQVKNPGERPWVDLTLSWLQRFGVKVIRDRYYRYQIDTQTTIPAFDYTVPADFSSMAFPLVAALITQSSLQLTGIDFKDEQGDKHLIDVLISMGANIRMDVERGNLQVMPGAKLKNRVISVNAMIDALPILAVVGCFGEGEMRLVDAAIARHKESDRIAVIATELNKMGASIVTTADGCVVQPAPLYGADLHSHQDHRIALSLTVAALAAKGKSTIHDVNCMEKSYASFIHDMLSVGADIKEVL